MNGQHEHEALLALPPRLRAIAVQTTWAKCLITVMAYRSRNFPEALERFEHLAALVRVLPPKIDHDEVYRILSRGVILCGEAEAFDPEWTRDRDDAYRTVERAIKKLRKVLAQRDLDHRVAGVERELTDLMQGGGEAGCDLVHRGSDRTDICPTRGGRPLARWRTDTIALLRAQKVSADDAQALLSATDLAGATPKAAPEVVHRETPRTF